MKSPLLCVTCKCFALVPDVGDLRFCSDCQIFAFAVCQYTGIYNFYPGAAQIVKIFFPRVWQISGVLEQKR